MAEIVRMPKLSDTMTEGVVAEWHKKVGESIESGDLLADIETDKATMEFESFQEGVLLHIGVEKGQTAPVDSILAILGEEGEDVTALLKEAEKEVEVTEKEEEQSQDVKPEVEKPSAPVAPVVSAPAPTPAPIAQQTVTSSNFPSTESISSLEIKASPLAKKLAEERGINLRLVKGTGTEGRIIKRDIDNFQGRSAISGVESFSDAPVSQMRKVIAQRLAESKFSAPHFYLTVRKVLDSNFL